MNVENIKRVRDHIASLSPERFDMDSWAYDPNSQWGEISTRDLLTTCDTCACIGGWTNALFPEELSGMARSTAAARALGLTTAEAIALFYPPSIEDCGENYYAATPAQAVAVLDHLLEAKVVNWAVSSRGAS